MAHPRKGDPPGSPESSTNTEPAILLAVPPQGSRRKTLDASPIRIERMIRGIFEKEQAISRHERTAAAGGRRMSRVNGEPPHYVKVSDIMRPLIENARRDRDRHVGELRHLIDYALTTGLYEDVRCPDCKPWSLPEAPLDFIRAVPEAEKKPAMPVLCRKCKGRGKVRVKKSDPESKEAFKRISYFKRVLNTTILVAKVRYRTSDSDEAYRELERKNRNLFLKFGNEAQTSLEGEDAEQGVRQGILDAVRRFDPTRPEMAVFTTVAFNWARRNSRARTDGQKRAGVYAPSIEDLRPNVNGETRSATAMITSTDGAFGSFSPDGADQTLVLDLREKIGTLPRDQREVVLAVMGGHNIASAAKSLGLSTVTARSLRDRAFAHLRKSLGGYVESLHD